METYKAKSLVPNKTDAEIKNGCHTVRFMSFESAIQLFRQEYNLMDISNKPIGYRVTEQGIEIIFQ